MDKPQNSIEDIKTDNTEKPTPLITFCCDNCKFMYNENNQIKCFTDDLKLVCMNCRKKKSEKTVIDRSSNYDLFMHSKQNLSFLKAQEMGRLKKLTCEIHKGEVITRFEIKEEKIKLGCDSCYPRNWSTGWSIPISAKSIDKFLDVFGFYFPECDSCISALEFEIKRLEFTCPNIEELRRKISSLTETFKSTTLDDLLKSKELFSIKLLENQNKLKIFYIIYNPIIEIINEIKNATKFLKNMNSITKSEIEDLLSDLIKKSNVNLEIVDEKGNDKEVDYLNQKELTKNQQNGPEDQQIKEDNWPENQQANQRFYQEIDRQDDQRPQPKNNQELHSKYVKNHHEIRDDRNENQSLQSENEPKHSKVESRNLPNNPESNMTEDKVSKRTISDLSNQHRNIQIKFHSNNQNDLSYRLETTKPETDSSKEGNIPNSGCLPRTKQNDGNESFENTNEITSNKSQMKTTINSKTDERDMTEDGLKSGIENDGNNADDLKQPPRIAIEEGSQNIVKTEIERKKTESRSETGNSHGPNIESSQLINKNEFDQTNFELPNTVYETKKEDEEMNKLIILEENKSVFRDELNERISDFGEIEKENNQRFEEKNKGEITPIESNDSKQTTVANDYKLDSEKKTDQSQIKILQITGQIETLKSTNKNLKEEILKQNFDLITNRHHCPKEIESFSDKNINSETDREKSKSLLKQGTFELKARADDNLKEIVTISQQVKALESIFESNHSKFEAEINQKTTHLETKIIQSSETISSTFNEELKKLKSTQSTDKETLMGEIKIIADSNSNLTQTVNKSIEDANAKIRNLESSDKILQTDLNNFNRTIRNYINNELIKKIKQIEKEFEAKDEKFKENQKLIEQLQTEFKTSNNLFKLELKQKDEKIQEQNKSNELFKQELKKSNDEFMFQWKFKNDELESQLAFQKKISEAEKKEIDTKYDVLEKSFKDYKTQTDMKMRKLETDNQQTKSDLSQKISVIDTHSTLSIENLDKKIDEKTDESKKMINQIESLIKTIQTNQRNFEEFLEKTKIDLKTESDELKTLLIQSIGETESTLDQKIEKLKNEKNDELKQKINELTKSFEMKNKEIENLKTENKRVLDERIEQSQKSIQEMVIKSETNFEERFADMTQTIVGIIQEAQNLMKEKFKSVDEKIEDFQIQITGNKTKLIEKMNEDKKSFEEKMDELKNQVKQNEEKRIEEMNKIKRSFDETTKEIQNQIKNNENKLTETINEIEKSFKDRDAFFDNKLKYQNNSFNNKLKDQCDKSNNKLAEMNNDMNEQKSLFDNKLNEVDKIIKYQEALYNNKLAEMNNDMNKQKSLFDNKLSEIDKIIKCQEALYNNKLAEMNDYMNDIEKKSRDRISESEKKSGDTICEKSNEIDTKVSDMRIAISRDILRVKSDLQSEILDMDIPRRYPLLEQLLLVNDLRQHLQIPDMKRELECKIAQTEQNLANQIHSKSNELQKNIEESSKNSNKYLLKVESELKRKIEQTATYETKTPTDQTHQNDAEHSSKIKEQIINECNNYTDEMFNKFSHKLDEIEQNRDTTLNDVYLLTKMQQSNSKTHNEDITNELKFKPKQKDAPRITPWIELQQDRSFSESVVLDSTQSKNEASALIARLKFSRHRFLFRMSDSPKSFHEVCDGVADTVLLVKLKDDTLVTYVDTPWSSPSTPEHRSSERSFFYSLNSNKLFTLNAQKKNTALFHSESQGPCFGDDEFSSISMKNRVFVCRPGNTFIDTNTKKSMREVIFGDSDEVVVENYEVYGLK